MLAPLSSAELSAYLAKLGYDGPRAATPDVLAALHLLHPAAIPYENLDPLLGRPVLLDHDAVFAKLVGGRRGGYCFEQNQLFARALAALGFERIEGMAARVLWNVPEGRVNARSHMVLRIELPDGPWLADVGFGGLTMTGPLRFVPGERQATPHEDFRVAPHGRGYAIEADLGGEWRATYSFEPFQQFAIDYEVSNHYVSTHPNSVFLRQLMAARPTAEARHTLADNVLTIRRRDGTAEKRLLPDADAIVEALDTVFGIDVPDRTALSATVARLGLATSVAASPERV